MSIPAKIITWQMASQIKPCVCLQKNGGCISPYLGVICVHRQLSILLMHQFGTLKRIIAGTVLQNLLL